ncbi:MAG: hypothetical protein AB1782_20310 [Cyanobacteriota bacterium]
MNNIESNLSLASDSRIQKLLEEAENELSILQPEIDYLEGCVAKLNDLKLKKNKLLSLKASLITLLKQQYLNNKDINTLNNQTWNETENRINFDLTKDDLTKIDLNNQINSFTPELALDQVKKYLRTNNNLNYEIFKAIVYNAGEANTEDIKNYLVKNRIKQPKTGKYFNDVELKDISSRVNYLIRKKLLITTGPGSYKVILGYINHN